MVRFWLDFKGIFKIEFYKYVDDSVSYIEYLNRFVFSVVVLIFKWGIIRGNFYLLSYCFIGKENCNL